MRYVFKVTNFGEQDLGEPKRLRNDRKVKPSELKAKFAIFNVVLSMFIMPFLPQKEF